MEETKQEISLATLIQIMLKHITLLISMLFVGIALAGVTTFFILTPRYSSETQLVVTLPQSRDTNTNDVTTNLQMINTYKELVTSEVVLTQVREQLESQGISLSTEKLKDKITVTQSQNSLMFTISVRDTSPTQAQQIANTTAGVFQREAKNVLNVDKITIISQATADSKPVFPRNTINLFIGAILGLFVGIVIIFFIEMFDRTIKDEYYITEMLHMTILGSVPQMTEQELRETVINTQQKRSWSGKVSKNSSHTYDESKEERKHTKRRKRDRI